VSALRDLVVEYISRTTKGQVIQLGDLSSRVYEFFPDICRHLGFTNSYPIEEKWRNEIRWGLRDCARAKLD
jgi:hypothetical protein